MTNTKRPRLYIDVLLTVLALLTILMYSVSNRFVFYRVGLNPLGSWFFLMIPVVSMIQISFFIQVVILVVRGAIVNVRFGIKRLFIQILLIVITITLSTIVPKSIGKLGSAAFTEGFLERMKKEADVPAIQAWINTLDSDTLSEFEEDEYGWWIDEDKWPDAIKMFSSENVDVLGLKSKNDKTYVRVLFGTALLGRWSLVVGVGAEEIPLNDHYESEYRLELAPNAFVGRRLKHAKED